MPKISVLMGVLCTQERFSLLQKSVNSILEQTYADFEFLICDDGSDVFICDYFDAVVREDSRVKLVRTGKNMPLAGKLNACFRKATGDFLARMDDDDYSHPNRFEKQVAYLNACPEIAFVGSNVQLVQGGQIKKEKQFLEYPRVSDFYMTQPFIHPSVMMRRTALAAVGGYREDKCCVLCEDYDLFLRLYKNGKTGANVQEALFDYTIPMAAKGNRKWKHRLNEVIVRYQRFRDLGCLRSAFPYIVKPLAVGILPEVVLKYLKEKVRVD